MEAKLPPQNLEAEQSLLGCILIDKDSIIKSSEVVKVEDFYAEKNRIIYQVMLDLYAAHEPIDALTVSNKLEERDQLKNIGGGN